VNVKEWFYDLLAIPHFRFGGEVYNGNRWKIVNDPSDVPPPDWIPPGGDWANWQQDKMVVRK
jgi:hypothetical protein